MDIINRQWEPLTHLQVVEHKAGQRTGGIMNTRKTGLLCF